MSTAARSFCWMEINVVPVRHEHGNDAGSDAIHERSPMPQGCKIRERASSRSQASHNLSVTDLRRAAESSLNGRPAVDRGRA
jgi:hypothetical protein